MFPRSLVYPGLGQITETDPTKLVRELHATAIAINQAKARKDIAGVQNLMQHFRDVADQYISLGAQADAAEFSWLDKFILATGTWIEDSIKALPGAIAAVPSAIGEGIIKASFPFILLFGGYIVLRNWGKKK